MVAVLDWEISTLGHPLADLAYLGMPWTNPLEFLGKALPGGIPTERESVNGMPFSSAISPFPSNCLVLFSAVPHCHLSHATHPSPSCVHACLAPRRP